MKKEFLSVCIFTFCLVGCNNIDTDIYRNKSFEDVYSIASDNNSPFCIVLVDSSLNLSKDYLHYLQKEFKYLPETAIYNIIDVNSEKNEWFLKWLCPASTPLTCVFSSDGRLVDLIPGASKESFLYIEEAIDKMQATDFHWPNRFKMNKKEIIPLLNNLLKQKELLNNGIYTASEMGMLIDSLRYPYSVYLKLIGELMENNTIELQQAAISLIELETPSSLELYKNEFITAKRVLNPDFDISTEPNIKVDKESIIFENCIINETTPINITINNNGSHPLKISKIHLSCSCLKSVNKNENIIINAKGSYIAKFHFTPDHEGEIFRDILIASNAFNTPILHINIKANVTNNTNN